MNDNITFNCQMCGHEFEPEPDSFLETGFSSDYHPADLSEKDLEEMVASGAAITSDKLEAMSEYELSEIGLSLQDREKLLVGSTVEIGAMCVCKECQDEMDAE